MTHIVHHDDPMAFLRDSVQARVLSKLFAQNVHGLVLKGGLAMRVLHDHARATKDIDLDADHTLPLASVQQHIRKAIKQATVGLLQDVIITEPKQTDTTLRWKIAGQDPVTKMTLHLTVEVSHRHTIDQDDVCVPDSTHPLFSNAIQVYKSDVLALNKLTALLSPTRDAPRDILDLYMLITSHVQPSPFRLRRWMQEHGPVALEQMWLKIDSMDKKRFTAEVLPSLGPSPHAAEWDDWDNVRLCVGTTIEKWLATATDPSSANPSTKPSTTP